MTTVTFRNFGKEPHNLTFARLDAGATADQFLASLGEVFAVPTGPQAGQTMKEFAVKTTLHSGIVETEPQASHTVTVDLTPGRYLMYCYVFNKNGPHFTQGMTGTLSVSGASTNADPPASDVTVRGSENRFDLPSTIAPGSRSFRFLNTGREHHEMSIARIKPGTTTQKVTEDIKKEIASGRPSDDIPAYIEPIGGSNVLGPGRRFFFTGRVVPGNYIFICAYRDSKNGLPHYFDGMFAFANVRE